MQWYGHDGIGAFEDRQSLAAHEPGERLGKLPPSLKLERVDQLAQRALMGCGTSGL
jgi:hypothetical protein